ncbi:uncharacterized protein LOC125043924 [Penaeus chinensis]|uniref:uncharacterized protein LOC125043924 n=1 Tax=Penaeus chinensis TaxID=139456 RepID=UPI001FB66018|nr:uncharacterized protein LOC125043924 [Penaeus chinensis]XP_047496260.1 uncharacterized protein LOC125043924 [Penaeus chinensis]
MSQMTRTLGLAVVLTGLVAVGASSNVSKESCSSVKVLGKEPSEIRLEVLQGMCEKMFDHVLLSGSSSRECPSTASQPQRRTTQAALVVLHNDSSNSYVTWDAGAERNVITKKGWYIDEEVSLRNGYRWYSHGLPMWPFLNRMKTSWNIFKKEPRWPNYALATPLYLVPAEQCENRNPLISVGKFFSKELMRPRSDPVDSFSRSTVKDDVRNFVLQHFFVQNQVWRENADKDFEKCEHWFQPLVRQSLKPMIKSFVKQHKSKCPDETYVFFFRQPCESMESCQVIEDFKREFDKCPSTEMVVGFLKPLAY